MTRRNPSSCPYCATAMFVVETCKSATYPHEGAHCSVNRSGGSGTWCRTALTVGSMIGFSSVVILREGLWGRGLSRAHQQSPLALCAACASPLFPTFGKLSSAGQVLRAYRKMTSSYLQVVRVGCYSSNFSTYTVDSSLTLFRQNRGNQKRLGGGGGCGGVVASKVTLLPTYNLSYWT